MVSPRGKLRLGHLAGHARIWSWSWSRLKGAPGTSCFGAWSCCQRGHRPPGSLAWAWGLRGTRVASANWLELLGLAPAPAVRVVGRALGGISDTREVPTLPSTRVSVHFLPLQSQWPLNNCFFVLFFSHCAPGQASLKGLSVIPP